MSERDLSLNQGARMYQIGVIGGSDSNIPQEPQERQRWLSNAESVGREIAKSGGVLISGGMDGIMEASSRGAMEAGGLTVGTPGRERGQSNEYIQIEICTPIDTGDYLFAGVPSCDSIVVFPGGAGTLAEVALAYRYEKPMVIMRGYDSIYDSWIGNKLDRSERKLAFYGADSPVEAVEIALREAKKYREKI